MNTTARKLSFIESTPKGKPCSSSSTFCIDNKYYYCCACSKTLINTCRINVPWWEILNIVYNDAMYTLCCAKLYILSTEVQGPSLTLEWNAAMAPSIATVVVRALAITSLFFHFLYNFTCNVSEALMLAMSVL